MWGLLTILCVIIVFVFCFLACPEGSYKSVQGNSACEDCPDNSTAVNTGQAICQCVEGFYRANNEGPEIQCTGKSYMCVCVCVCLLYALYGIM